MMRIKLLLILLACSSIVMAQDNDELDKRNGFKDIKLLSAVKEYSGVEYWKDQKELTDHAIYRKKKKSYDKIGDVNIHKLNVYTYRNLVYKIEVITDKNEKLFRSLEKAFGKIRYSMGSQVSYWEGKEVRLTYESESSNKIKLTYTAKGINKIIASDKNKAVDSLSSEF